MFLRCQVRTTSHRIPGPLYNVLIRPVRSFLVWQWKPEENRTAIAHGIRTCRNFDRIMDWAKENQLQHHIDLSVHIEDDIEIPIIF